MKNFKMERVQSKTLNALLEKNCLEGKIGLRRVKTDMELTGNRKKEVRFPVMNFAQN